MLSPPGNGETVTGRPLLNLSFAINYALGGTEVWGYHVANLGIHVRRPCCCWASCGGRLLTYRWRQRWGSVRRPRLALAWPLLWAVHPLQTESVTYIVQRAESLAGCSIC